MKPDAIDPAAGDLAGGVCGGAGLKSDTNNGCYSACNFDPLRGGIGVQN
jgi:hypothetical protein